MMKEYPKYLQTKILSSFRARVTYIRIAEVSPKPREYGGEIYYFVTLVREDGSETGISEFDPSTGELQVIRQLDVGKTYAFPEILFTLEKSMKGAMYPEKQP